MSLATLSYMLALVAELTEAVDRMDVEGAHDAAVAIQWATEQAARDNVACERRGEEVSR